MAKLVTVQEWVGPWVRIHYGTGKGHWHRRFMDAEGYISWMRGPRFDLVPRCADGSNNEPRAPEVLYAIRREDGDTMGDFSFLVVSGPADWSPALEEAEYAEEGTVYEMVKMTCEVIDSVTLPVCKQCDDPATHWGLCEKHAREDDPEHFKTKAEA